MNNYVRILDPFIMNQCPESKVYTSLEGENPSGSIKDHMIEKGLNDLFRNGLLRPGGDIAEISAGSTALSLAYYSQQREINCHLFLPDDAPLPLRNKLVEMKAKIYLVKKESAYQEYLRFLDKTSIRPFDQMFDHSKSNYYEKIGEEFKVVCPKMVNAVIGAVGTGHSLAGISKGISRWSKGISTLSAEPIAGLQISGVRNIELQSMGENDPCKDRFDARIILSGSELCPNSSILTDQGMINIGPSFQLTLGAVKAQLRKRPGATIFAVGANNKRENF